MRPLNIPLVIGYVSIASILIPLTPGLLFLKRHQGKMRLLFWLLIVSFISDVVVWILLVSRENSWPVVNLFFAVQFVLLFLILGDNIKIAWIRSLLLLGCLSFGLIDFFFLQTSHELNSYSSYVYAITMIALVISFFYQLLKTMPVEKIQTSPLFWLAFGVLVYYGGSLFLFLFNNYLLAHQLQVHQNTWTIHNILNILKNVFLFTTLWINYKSRTSPL